MSIVPAVRNLRSSARLACLMLCLTLAPLLVLDAQEPTPGQLPTPDQARVLLQSRPELVEQLRARLGGSGLTPDQVRARLRAAGYPEDFLDPYLAGADTTRSVAPAPGTLDAVRSLGILGAESVDSLGGLDSTRIVSDSVQQFRDSILAVRADSARSDSLADSLAASRGQLKVFGTEVFRRATTRFQAAEAGPVDENYRLGPGDVLVLILTGDVERAQTLEVTREGFVVIPQVGQVYVANLTLGQLEDQLYSRLGRVYSGVRRGANASTRFQISVSRLRKVQVFVVGDVVRPGSYQVSGAGTVLTALYAAGGPTTSGSFRQVQIRRGNKVVDSLDIYGYLLRGLNASDVRLQNGDVVFVPVRGGYVKVAGEVVRPAIYEVKPEETLRDVIGFAGGFDATAYQARVQIHRVLPPGSRGPGGRARVVIDIGAEQFADGVIPAVPMAAGDSVTVFQVAERVRGFVTVNGNVWVEGAVGFVPGMKLSDAIRLAGGPKPDVYLDQILVTRLRSDSTRAQLRSAFADSTGNVTKDLALQEEDEIRIFSRSTFRPARYVSIVGAVRTPGRIPYREGMTVRDAVLLADGVTEDAYLKEAEIARIPEARPTGTLAKTLRVPLDSTFLFDRGPKGEYRGPPGLPTAAGGAPDVPLQPYDNVLILRQPGWNLQRLVYIQGQVKYAGRYALESKTERLSDLLRRAGGLTEQAYAGGVEFYRFTGRGGVPRPGTIARGETRLSEDLPRGYKERVGVDLPGVLKDSTDNDNLILAAGDSIYVPEYDPVVTVMGGVNSPGSVAFVPGRSIDWYVRAAGGYSRRGDKKRVYVTQPNGKKETVSRRFLLPDGTPKPGPGAMVFVPEKDPAEPGSNIASILGTAAQVVGALVTIIVVARR